MIKAILTYGGFCCLFFLAACYQPKEGCLNIQAANYDVSADDACADCCEFPKLTVVLLHQVVLPTLPDTFFTFKYKTKYPSPFDTTHYFEVQRSRYFLTGFRLVRENGDEVGIRDSITLEAPAGVPLTVENNFAKADRDIFQPGVINQIITSGPFRQVKFTLGLNPLLIQTDPKSIVKGHPLSTASDTLIYEEGTGYIPNQLIFCQDTFPGTDSLVFRFTTPQEVLLDLPQPFELDRGFDVKITLRINYIAWFEGIDLQNDTPLTIEQKLEDNLIRAFSVGEIKME